MRLDFFRLGGQLGGRALVVRFLPFGVFVMKRDVRIGDRRLFEIFVDAAAAALKLRFQFDGDARAALHFLRPAHRFWPAGVVDVVMGHPLDAVLGDVLAALFARRNVDAFALAVEDLGLVPLGVDLDFEVVRRLARADPRDDL